MTRIQFSQHPGAHERHLKRRYHNPLFPPERRELAQHDVEIAAEKDREEEISFLEELKALLEKVTTFSAREETEVILEIKQQTDKMYEQCAGLRGEHSREKAGLVRLNEVIMNSIRAAAGDDPLAKEELDKEQAARELHMHLLEYSIVPDLLRPDSLIEEDELIPSLLSEEAETIKMVMTLFDDKQRKELLELAAKLIEELKQQGELDSVIEERFAAIQAPPQ
jgi:hypothetical protein